MNEIPWPIALVFCVIACAAGWVAGMLVGWYLGKRD